MSEPGEQPERRRRNHGRLDHPARRADLAPLPPDFGRRYLVFVDTEEEFDWSRPRSRQETATSAVRHLPEFQRLMDAHGAQPCYLIDWPVADNAESGAIMRDLHDQGRCSVGTQLHAWVSPPFDEEVTTFNSFAGNLPLALERAKLARLTQRIDEVVGRQPIIYRAGRYGIGPHTAMLLEELGYRADTSVRPTFDYSHEGGPNFRRHAIAPYWTGPGGTLLELPLSVAYTGRLRRYGRWLFGDARANPRRVSLLARANLLARVALTPEDMPFEDVERAIRSMVQDGVQLFSFSFHSPSLAPGHTPYVRNSAELNAFYRWWERLLALLEALAIAPASVDETIDAAWACRSVRAS